MESNNSIKVKDLLLSFLPIAIMILGETAIILADILVLFVKNILSIENRGSLTIGEIMTQDYNQPMNTAYMTLAQYAVFILIFGYWLYKLRKKSNIEILPKAKALIKNPFIYLLIITGFMGQIFTDSCMNLLRPVFSETFANYDLMVSKSIGANASLVMILCVIIIAPIAEELMFRGVMLSYQKSGFGITTVSSKIIFSIIIMLLQGILFGFYHGNIVQGAYAFVFGIVLSLVVLYADNLIAAIMLHMSLNVSALFVPDALFRTPTLCTISAIVSLIILVASLFVALKFKDFTFKIKATEEE